MTSAVQGRTDSSRTLDRRGVTLVEVLMVLVIVSILAVLVQPNLHRALVRARAVEVFADLGVVERAVHEYQASTNTWPEERSPGEIPGGLDTYLPGGFDFRQENYILDYDNWSSVAAAPFKVGLAFICDDEELRRAVLGILGSNAWTNGSTKVTLILER